MSDAPDTPDPGISQDPGIPGHRAPEQLPEEPETEPSPTPEDPNAHPETDEEGHRAQRD
jgi:hypothetical protein